MRSYKGRVLVTGANGMLATNLVEELVAQGYDVRGVLRSRARYRGVVRDGVELVECDFTDAEAMKCHLVGCDYVVHSAAETSQSLLDYEHYRRVNVTATKRLLEIAMECGVRRFVYVSTANTVGLGTPDKPSVGDEPMDSLYDRSMYAKSKYEGEQAVLAMSDRAEVVVVNPTFMIGRYGTRGGSNQIFGMVKPTMVVPNGGKSFVDVEEAARAIIVAMERGVSGVRYVVSGENLSFKELFSRFSKVKRIFVIPKYVLLAAGVVGSALRRLGLACELSYTNALMITNNVGYTTARVEALGFVPKGLRPADEYLEMYNRE